MKKTSSLLILSVFLIFSIAVFYAPAQANQNQMQPSDFQGGQGGQMGQGGPGMQGGKPPMPPMLNYIGFAVENESNFEMARVFIFPAERQKKGAAEMKKPAGTLELGKQKYFIVEAKIETEEATLQIAPQGQDQQNVSNENAQTKKPAPMKIKSCEGKISKSYYERMVSPPSTASGDGNSSTDTDAAKGKAEIVGDIKLTSAEKQISEEKKVTVLTGTVSTGEQKFTLYLEPRVMVPGKPPMPPNNQNQGGQQTQQPQTGE